MNLEYVLLMIKPDNRNNRTLVKLCENDIIKLAIIPALLNENKQIKMNH